MVTFQYNDALMFANDTNEDFKIMRIYVNEDEAIWTLREVNIAPKKDSKSKPKKKQPKDDGFSSEESDSDESDEENHRDYYIVLPSVKDEVPPECAWEAVDPHGFVACFILYSYCS